LKKQYEFLCDKAKGLNRRIEDLIVSNQTMKEAQSSEVQKHSDNHEIALREFFINDL